MIELLNTGAYLVNGIDIIPDTEEGRAELKARTGAVPCPADAAKETIAYGILKDHNVSGNMENLQIKFDKLTSHDITFVGIIQTARASGLEKFPVPYVLTNCHNSLCAVGGTINEDDHMFGLTCAKKYGGVYVPPHQAVIHQFAREMLAGGGKMILGSDSHTRYGALGTMAMGEGGPELVKQLLSKTYDIAMPGVIAIYMTGAPQPGVGPQDIALAIIGAVFANGYVKNKVMEFVGPGVSSLSADYRIGVDVMTTETTCLSSIWRTDEKISEFYQIHGRSADYKELNPGAVAYYDGVVKVELDKIKPMIAMPFHPSNVYTIEELKANLDDILNDVEKKAAISLDGKVPFTLKNKVHDGKLLVDQGIIAGCAGGGFENICDAADILKGHSIGDDAFTLSVYPASTPIYMELARNGKLADLLETGAIVKTHSADRASAQAILRQTMRSQSVTPPETSRTARDPRSRTVRFLPLPDGCTFHCSNRSKQGIPDRSRRVHRNIHETGIPLRQEIYENRVFDSKGVADPSVEIQFGPNIKDWPAMPQLAENLILKVVSEIHDPVTTTDELIPSGETSSFRSNPLGLAEFTLSRKDPAYVGRAKEVQVAEKAIQEGNCPAEALPELKPVFAAIHTQYPDIDKTNVGVGSTIFAVKPGDGSAREQAASCQKVLGGWANIANEYATKRYRSNLINWGMLPFLIPERDLPFTNGDYIFVPEIRKAVEEKADVIKAYVVKDGALVPFEMTLGALTDDEREIIRKGCLINYYRG